MTDSKVFKFLNKYKFTLLFLLYIFLITCLVSEKRVNFTLLVALTSGVTLLFIQNLLAKTKYTLPITILFIVILSFDAFFAFVYRSYLTIFILGSFFETDQVEAREALGQFAIVAVPIVLVTSLLVLLSQRELRKDTHVSRKLSLLVLLAYFLVVVPAVTYIKLKKDETAQNYISLDPLLTIEGTLKNILPVFYGDFSTFGIYQYRMWEMRSFIDHERSLPKGVTFDKEKPQPEKIYFIIGETARRDHMSLYGYSVKTTPFLDSLYQSQTLDFTFHRGVAPAPLTREALRIILSFASPVDGEPFYKEKNVVELAQDAGYTAYWISNQDKMALGDGYVGFVSSRSDFMSFRDRFNDGRLEDLNLVQLVSEKSEKGKKQIFFIHLVGSHSAYDQRYDDVDKQSIGGSGIVTDYDRSIHHTDRVFRAVYDLMKADPSAAILYFSDHGEVIGKGHAMGWQQDYIVPFLAMSNDSAVVNTSQIMDKYVDEESFINTSSAIYIISEMLGYKIDDQQVSKSKADGKYVLNRIYMPEKFSNIKAAEE